MGISGKTMVFCVIGDPIEHSLSPVMHNAAFTHLELDAVYVAFRVKSEEIGDAMRGLRSLGIKGVNVTMPHKSSVINYLNEVDPLAKFVGAVNTILNLNGRLIGFNTDGIGALKALQENQADPEGKTVLILGAGGAARAIAYQLAQTAEEVRLLNRNGAKARRLAKLLRAELGKAVVGDQLSPHKLKEWLLDADILINATSVGMHPDVDNTLVKPELLSPKLVVMDIVYNPIETKLLKDARNIGAKTIHGTEMLLFQGAASFEIWLKCPAPVEVMREAMLRKLKGMNEH